MTTTEKNKLIAEFMGFKSTNNCVRCGETGKYFDFHYKKGFSCIKEEKIQVESEWGWGLVEQDFLFAEDLKFHTSWDWLMPVVEKIESLPPIQFLDRDWIGFDVKIYKTFNTQTHYCTVKYLKEKGEFTISNGFSKQSKIEAVYNACIDFIMWYNAAKKD